MPKQNHSVHLLCPALFLKQVYVALVQVLQKLTEALQNQGRNRSMNSFSFIFVKDKIRENILKATFVVFFQTFFYSYYTPFIPVFPSALVPGGLKKLLLPKPSMKRMQNSSHSLPGGMGKWKETKESTISKVQSEIKGLGCLSNLPGSRSPKLSTPSHSCLPEALLFLLQFGISFRLGTRTTTETACVLSQNRTV